VALLLSAFLQLDLVAVVVVTLSATGLALNWLRRQYSSQQNGGKRSASAGERATAGGNERVRIGKSAKNLLVLIPNASFRRTLALPPVHVETTGPVVSAARVAFYSTGFADLDDHQEPAQ